jgi:hypothetical protein
MHPSCVVAEANHEAIDFDGVCAENRISICLAQLPDEILHRGPPTGVRRSEQAHGPIRASHQAAGTECIQRDIEVGTQCGGGPRSPVSLGDHSCQLAVDIFMSCKFGKLLLPWVDLPLPNSRLGSVIENKDLVGMAMDELDCLRQVPFVDEDFIQPRLLHLADATIEVGLKDESIVGFILDIRSNHSVSSSNCCAWTTTSPTIPAHVNSCSKSAIR